jgi:hypothetical protein
MLREELYCAARRKSGTLFASRVEWKGKHRAQWGKETEFFFTSMRSAIQESKNSVSPCQMNLLS